MTPVVKLMAFAAVLVAVFSGGLALGAAVGPFDDAPPRTIHSEHRP